MAYTLKPLPDYTPPPPAPPPAEPEVVVQAPVAVVPQPLGTETRRAKVVPTSGHPLYIPSQRKLLRPNIPTPLILDRWVLNQINSGVLELVDG